VRPALSDSRRDSGATGRLASLATWLAIAAALPSCGSAVLPADDAGDPTVRIGSKKFTESVILGELATALARDAGADVRYRAELGGTRLLWNALLRGDLDAYPEYTGTLLQEILAGEGIVGEVALRNHLRALGIRMGRFLGFDNTYALGMTADRARALGIHTISDLRPHPGLRFGFTGEFLDRGDGWPSLRDAYDLPHRDVRGLDHDLAYRGLQDGSLDVIDLYATDAEIRYYGLLVLEDDRDHFDEYQAVLLWRESLEQSSPRVVAALRRLEGRITATDMIRMNALAKLDRVPESRVASDFLEAELGLATDPTELAAAARIRDRTLEHLVLVGVSLGAAILLALPLGILSARRPRIGQVVLGVVGVVQTIPSLALLVFMIPLLGIGAPPAVLALFLYSLLPIVQNTHAGLQDIPLPLRESAEALGLPPRARLWRIELPLASRSILAGIKTSAVLNVGTATLGALIGAGGLGQPILTGIRLDDLGRILQGAVPAALLAVGVQFLFDASERWLVPRGLRLGRAG